MRPRRLFVLILSALVWGNCASGAADVPDNSVIDLSHAVTTPSGLRYIDHDPGHGPSPVPGEIVAIRYQAYLFQDGARGTKFDETKPGGKPPEFLFGRHRMIPAWDEALASMKAGGTRTLIAPPELAYGDRGAGGVVPPHATLVFDLELVAIKPPPKKPELDHPI